MLKDIYAIDNPQRRGRVLIAAGKLHIGRLMPKKYSLW
jgi:hypothetical protein